MPTSDTSEKGLESLIVAALVGHVGDGGAGTGGAKETGIAYGGAGYVQGDAKDYDRSHAIDLDKFLEFLRITQPDAFDRLNLATDGPPRLKFLARLQGEIAKRGIIDVLRGGVSHGPAHVDLFYGTPSPGNPLAKQRFDANIFSVTRQLQYSQDETRLALDLVLFINGLPIATFELKNSLTKQTVDDAVQQYRLDRSPLELLFKFGRCLAHFAVDDSEVRFCTELKGKSSWFLPFNKGYNDGAGNPPNPAWPQDRLSVARDPDPPGADRHHRELRPVGGREGRPDRAQDAQADLPALSPARRRSQAPGGCRSTWRRSPLPDPAFGRQRQEQLDRLACPSADRSGAKRYGDFRFDHCCYRPPRPRQTDQRHHQAVRSGIGNGWTC